VKKYYSLKNNSLLKLHQTFILKKKERNEIDKQRCDDYDYFICKKYYRARIRKDKIKKILK